MNLQKLNLAKNYFYRLYPGGFKDEKLKDVEKRHKPQKMLEMAGEYFFEEAFAKPEQLLENWVKIVSRSSMVSLFEKPKFRDLTKSIPASEKTWLVAGLREFLYGNRELGFERMTDLLGQYKLAKWTLLTIVPYYCKPETEVFVKPTTTKMAISYFELEGLKYSAKPAFSFYEEYRKQFMQLKKLVGITNDNAAFGGFIMLTASGEVEDLLYE